MSYFKFNFSIVIKCSSRPAIFPFLKKRKQFVFSIFASFVPLSSHSFLDLIFFRDSH